MQANLDFIKPMVQAYYLSNREFVVENSMLHCHAFGVHSIVLHESKEGFLTRMFVAEFNHELNPDLYTNYLFPFTKPLQVGFHAHHCNSMLHVISGSLWHVIASKEPVFDDSLSPIQLTAWDYQSAIKTDGVGSFKLRGEEVLYPETSVLMTEGSWMHMSAQDIHTVSVKKNTRAIWMIYEGKRDPEYESVTWTNTDLTMFNKDKQLYVRPTTAAIELLFERSGLLS